MGLFFGKSKKDVLKKIRSNPSARADKFKITLSKTKSIIKGQKLFNVKLLK